MTLDMTTGKPSGLLVKFAMPLMVGNIFQQLYNIVDTIIVGKFVSAGALAAVGTTGSLFFLLNALMFGLCTGAGIIIAQYFGARNHKALRDTVLALIRVTGIVSVVLGAVGFVFAPLLLNLMRVPEDVINDAVTYLRIICAFLPFNAAYSASSAILRSVGDSKTPLLAMIVSSIANIGFNLLFVLVYDMGVAGVAYGTIISQFVAAAICIGCIYRNRAEIHLENMPEKINSRNVKLIIKTGIPSACQSALISLGGISVQGLVNDFGSQVMAGYAAVQRIDSIAIQVVVALATSLSVFTGQNIAIKELSRIREALRRTLFYQLISCTVLAILALVFKQQLISIFIDPVEAPQAITVGCQYLSIIGIAYVIAGIMNSYLSLIRGAGDVNVSLLAGIAEVIGRVIFANLLVGPLGILGIWLATPLSWGCGCIIPVIRYYKGAWKKHIIA